MVVVPERGRRNPGGRRLNARSRAHRPVRVVAALALSLLAGCQMPQANDGSASEMSSGSPNPSQPYAGLQQRPIAALSTEQVEDLLAGRGAGYALAAELNHYPGPTHVLELADQLWLAPEQRQRVEQTRVRMQEEAKRLGERLVDLEHQLDTAFGDRAIDERRLSELTSAAAEVEGRLRAVHLRAHLETRALLGAEQVARYDELRGYASGAPEPGRHQPGNGHGTHAP